MHAALPMNETDNQPRRLRDLITFGRTTGDLSFVLIRLRHSYGVPGCGSNDRYMMKQLTSAEIGSIIGTTGECVDQLMDELKRSEVLIYESGRIVVKKLSHPRSTYSRQNVFERYEYPCSKPFVS